MSPVLSDIEKDVESRRRLVLSMRTKVSLFGFCFLLAMGLVFYSNAPNGVAALRGLGQGATLAENESQPPEQETPPESPEQETYSESQSPVGDWVTLFLGDFHPPTVIEEYINQFSRFDRRVLFLDEQGDTIWTLWLDHYATLQDGNLQITGPMTASGHYLEEYMRTAEGRNFLVPPMGIELRLRTSRA